MRELASMTRAVCGLSTVTVTISAPNGPMRTRRADGSGVTAMALRDTVWVADERGVRRRTQRAKLTARS
jgi:hypothetical protein